MKLVAVINYLHSKGIAAVSLHPHNIFVSKDCSSLKLQDYMWAPLKEHLSQQAILRNRPDFFSPEVFDSFSECSTASDLFSLGVLLYWMLVAETPCSGQGSARAKIKIINKGASAVYMNSEFPSSLRDLLCSLLSPVASMRPSA